jgi:hypothetical protein
VTREWFRLRKVFSVIARVCGAGKVRTAPSAAVAGRGIQSVLIRFVQLEQYPTKELYHDLD